MRTIKPSSAVSSGRWPLVRWRRSTIGRGRAGRRRTAQAKAWVVDLACRKAKELGYPHELWITRLLARHVREHGPAEGHACLAKLAQGTLCNILNEQEIKPHKVRYYLERRDPEFKQKMAEVLCVYREVKLIKETAAAAKAMRNGSGLGLFFLANSAIRVAAARITAAFSKRFFGLPAPARLGGICILQTRALQN